MNREDKQKTNEYANKSFRYMVVGTSVMIIAAIATSFVFGFYIRTINTLEKAPERAVNGHYIFISEDDDKEFWEQVYISAKEKAEEDRIYLENIKDSLQTSYSNEDLLRVAINSSVDGIIYSGSASAEAVELIDTAVEKGIGVSVLHNDIDQSQRQCFVGVSNYELGQMYASQIIEIVNSTDMSDVTINILISSEISEGASNLITLAIEDSLLGVVEEEALPYIEVIRITAEDTFSVEEDIRNLFVSGQELPDVMLCLEGIYTQCAYQAVVDYNRVGEVQIVGYFSSEDILEAIDRQIVYSTISVDTKEMGYSAVTAIQEYNEFGYTNSYLPVSMEIIDRNKAQEMIADSQMIGDSQTEESK